MSVPQTPALASFNPRTPAGCDRSRVAKCGYSSTFQSTHPCGVRLARPMSSPVIHFSFQSTHPCGVRRPTQGDCCVSCRGFNPRTPAGCDKCCGGPGGTEGRFQSTHPCGVRQQAKLDIVRTLVFQSTHPCGVRHRAGVLRKAGPGVSIHAPLRGATHSRNPMATAATCFNPRTPAGCDRGGMVMGVSVYEVSIHAPLRGATGTTPNFWRC